MDLAAEVSCRQTYHWTETRWEAGQGYGTQTAPRHKVVAVDYGAKRHILRCLASLGCDVTVVPAAATADDSPAPRPAGTFPPTAPADPHATDADRPSKRRRGEGGGGRWSVRWR